MNLFEGMQINNMAFCIIKFKNDGCNNARNDTSEDLEDHPI